MATTKRNTPTKRRTPTTTIRKHNPPSTTTNHRNIHLTTTLSPLIPTVSSAISAAHTFLTTHDTHLLPQHLHSIESSLSKLHSLLQFTQPPENHLKITVPPPSTCWFERFVLSSITDEDPRWSHVFRMSKPIFSLLSSVLSNSLVDVLPPSIPPHFAVGCALYKLAHDVSFSFVGRRFGFSSSDACRAFYAVCKVICGELGGYFGNFGEEIAEISLKNCFGALGFEKFRVDDAGLLGKDGFLIVQAVVDSKGSFLDVSAGWPNTFLPESILRQSRLFSGVVESKELLNGPEIELFDGNRVNQYVLGDGYYPCLPWLITPFVKKGEGEDGLSEGEIEFNEVHKRVLGLVKMAFRRVRANWKLVNRRWKEEFVEFLPFVITSACVLNNFLMKHGEAMPDGAEESGEEVEEMPVYEGEVCESGVKVRNLLALHLSRVSQGKDD